MRNHEKGGRLETKLITASIRGARGCCALGFVFSACSCALRCALCALARLRLLSKGPAPVTCHCRSQRGESRTAARPLPGCYQGWARPGSGRVGSGRVSPSTAGRWAAGGWQQAADTFGPRQRAGGQVAAGRWQRAGPGSGQRATWQRAADRFGPRQRAGGQVGSGGSGRPGSGQRTGSALGSGQVGSGQVPPSAAGRRGQRTWSGWAVTRFSERLHVAVVSARARWVPVGVLDGDSFAPLFPDSFRPPVFPYGFMVELKGHS